jgi:hypothetical protein
VGAACVGAGWCCSRNPGAEHDSSAGQYFCDQLVVLIFHLILFLRDESVDIKNNAAGALGQRRGGQS